MSEAYNEKCLFKWRGMVCSPEQVKACGCKNPNFYPYVLPFRIRRQYFDAFMNDTKDTEVREDKEFWQVRARHAQLELDAGRPVIMALISGDLVLRILLERITFHKTAEDALGRPPSMQGVMDIGEGSVIAFHADRRSLALGRAAGACRKLKEVQDDDLIVPGARR